MAVPSRRGSLLRNDAEQFLERKLNQTTESVCRAIIDQQTILSLHNSRRENHVRHEPFELVIHFRHNNLTAAANDVPWVFDIQQERSGRIGADTGIFFLAAVTMINLQPA